MHQASSTELLSPPTVVACDGSYDMWDGTEWEPTACPGCTGCAA